MGTDGASPGNVLLDLELLDEQGEPVPWFGFALGLGEDSQDFATDALGTCTVEVPRAWLDRDLLVTPFDDRRGGERDLLRDPAVYAELTTESGESSYLLNEQAPGIHRWYAPIALSPQERPLANRIEVPVGPTFRIQPEPVPKDRAEQELWLLFLDRRFSSDPLEWGHSRRAPLRGDLDAGFWVRFGPDIAGRFQPLDAPAMLHARVGEAVAFAPVGTLRAEGKLFREPVELRPLPPVAVEGYLRSTQGEVLGEGQVLASSGGLGLGFVRTDKRDGRFVFRELPPGTYEFVGEWKGMRGAARTYSIVATPTEELVIEVPLTAELFEVRGTLMVVGGVALEQATVFLVGEDVRVQAEIELEGEAPDRRGTFRFEQVPAGSYQLFASCRYGLGAFQPSWLDLRVPGDVAEFMYGPKGTARKLVLELVDADTGAPVERAQVFISQGGRREWFTKPSGISFSYFEGQGDVHFLCTALGYSPVSDESVELIPAEQGFEARVGLKRGWGVLVEVVDAEGRPVPGIRLAVPGAPPKETDADGRCVVTDPTAPPALEVDIGSWSALLPKLGGHLSGVLQPGTPAHLVLDSGAPRLKLQVE